MERDAVITGLPPRYFETYTAEQIDRHAEAARALSEETPLLVLPGERQGSRVGVTICGYDRPGFFSICSGVLGAVGFNIVEGHVFTAASGVAIDTFVGDAVVADYDAWIRSLQDQIVTILGSDDPSQAVIELVARSMDPGAQSGALLPIQIDISQDDGTALTVESQDTPFFLFSLSTALSFNGVIIDRVEIETRGKAISDRFWITDPRGDSITATAKLDQIRLAVVLTKEFTNALPQAADPPAAFARFEELTRMVSGAAAGEQIMELLADPGRMGELARLLGASTFLWEDFIRLQYENLLPVLKYDNQHQLLSTPGEELAGRLHASVAAANDFAGKVAALNAFKDHEAYRIDADHILRRNSDFFFLSHRLTRLAELVVDAAFTLAEEELRRDFGTPRTAAGLPAEYAVFGLGKLGGSALGYASDLEILFVYSDQGETDGAERHIQNREYFERLVRSASQIIEAKREGIFRVDLRLRPFGKDGPEAVHLDSFVSYFGSGGKAHAVERLALTRLRAIAGSTKLGEQVTAIRDQIVYGPIDVAEIREMRLRQIHEKTTPGRVNAKFSAGALVDLEYNVQLLQVQHGGTNPALRNPGIHATLRALSEAGTIDREEADRMVAAYRFLRNLINGLRMLRGNANDLFLPEFKTPEFVHLARRMGYADAQTLSAEEQLRVDFEIHTAMVRTFVERHLGDESVARTSAGNPADLVLSQAVGEEWSASLLGDVGFHEPDRGVQNLRRLAGGEAARFARLIVVAWDYLQRTSDPDMAVNNWERFAAQLEDRAAHFDELLAQPRKIEVLLTIFSGSQFLADTLIRTPRFLSWITDPDVIARPRFHRVLVQELTKELRQAGDRSDRLNRLRRFRKREILRIGARDICLAGDFTETITEISALARASIDAVAETGPLDGTAGKMAILAFGKLGGGELNYSSDIDLLAVYRGNSSEEDAYGRAFRAVVRDLSDFSEEGRAYRVDLRLRPYGDAGRLVYALPTALAYYEREAELWELQALLKLSPVAGDLDVAAEFTNGLRAIFAARLAKADRSQIVATVRHLRQRAVSEHRAEETGDIKNGEGGIRDIEFLVQAEQMMHHHLFPELFTGSTLVGIEKLEEVGIFDMRTASELRRDYVFLRRIEHFLQVYGDRQLHAIPREPRELAKLSAVVLGPNESAESLAMVLSETLTRVRAYYESFLTIS